jgi:uncharacterized membrane protein YciS (DUF1049 family)
MPLASSVFPSLFCTGFKVLGLILSPLIHFKERLRMGGIGKGKKTKNLNVVDKVTI